MQEKIKDSLNQIGDSLEINISSNDTIIYNAKLKFDKFAATITQFTNGTLLVQGKKDNLFDQICDLIEKIANPSESEVIIRYLSNNEAALKEFSEKDTPLMQERAKKEVEKKLGDAYIYIDEYNRKQFIVSQCLCNYKLDLPEHSALVMPASKGFEGFIKKLMIDINLVPKHYFSKKDANFGPLNDKTYSHREKLCKIDKYLDNYLKRIYINLNFCRHFMMHSDPTPFTIINTVEEAIDKVREIFKNTKEIFNYFNPIFKLI